MMGWSPRCYIPSFVKTGLPVQEKKIFEGFFTIYGRGGHLGHVGFVLRTKISLALAKFTWIAFIAFGRVGQGGVDVSLQMQLCPR